MSRLARWARALRDKSARRGFACDCCGAEIFDYPKHRVCKRCDESFVKNNALTCYICGRKTCSDGACLDCKSFAPCFDKGCSPFTYEGEVASLVNRLKNGGLRLAYFFAERIVDEFLQSAQGGRYALNENTALIIVPVPLTKDKQKARGYNQAEELAFIVQGLLNKRGILARVAENLLVKTRETVSQKDLDILERRINAKGAYRVKERKACKDSVILLIDDIMTTGATGNECARVLKNAGAKWVYFATCASLAEYKK